MEPLDVPTRWGWRDEIEAPPSDWWCGEEPVWSAPELDFGDGRVLVLGKINFLSSLRNTLTHYSRKGAKNA